MVGWFGFYSVLWYLLKVLVWNLRKVQNCMKNSMKNCYYLHMSNFLWHFIEFFGKNHMNKRTKNKNPFQQTFQNRLQLFYMQHEITKIYSSKRQLILPNSHYYCIFFGHFSNSRNTTLWKDLNLVPIHWLHGTIITIMIISDFPRTFHSH